MLATVDVRRHWYLSLWVAVNVKICHRRCLPLLTHVAFNICHRRRLSPLKFFCVDIFQHWCQRWRLSPLMSANVEVVTVDVVPYITFDICHLRRLSAMTFVTEWYLIDGCQCGHLSPLSALTFIGTDICHNCRLSQLAVWIDVWVRWLMHLSALISVIVGGHDWHRLSTLIAVTVDICHSWQSELTFGYAADCHQRRSWT